MTPLRADAAGPAERALRERAGGWPDLPSVSDLTADALLEITRREGVDFATALFFDRFHKFTVRAAFIRRIDALRQAASTSRVRLDARVVIVPGALYVDRPDLGVDGRLVREVAAGHGLESSLIPVASFGSLQHNAGLIRAWLGQHSGERIILVSLSKGGADVKLALAAPDAAGLFRNVAAWVNVCGPLNGSLMANWVLAGRARTWLIRWKFKRQKRDFQFVTGLQRGQGTPLDFAVPLPPGMKMLSLVGFPLKRHMTTGFSRFCHHTLAAHGPNDGTTTLLDVLDWPGEIYPVWGADHYFRPASVARELIAAVLRHLEEAMPATPDASHFSPPARMV